jgi:hypothetical protein
MYKDKTAAASAPKPSKPTQTSALIPPTPQTTPQQTPFMWGLPVICRIL